MILPSRWEHIVDFLTAHGQAAVEDIASATGVSPATVRRDLQQLDERGLVERVRGGAKARKHLRQGTTLAESRVIRPTEKESIGRLAATLVDPGDTLFIDGGYTTFQVARFLGEGPLTVVTNSFDVAQALVHRDDVTLVMLGGELSSATGITAGPMTKEQVQALTADKAILGADALSRDGGLGSPVAAIAALKQIMASNARELIVVADHSKLGQRALYRAVPVEAASTLVTDSKADPSVLKELQAAGVKILIAASDEKEHDQ